MTSASITGVDCGQTSLRRRSGRRRHADDIALVPRYGRLTTSLVTPTSVLTTASSPPSLASSLDHLRNKGCATPLLRHQVKVEQPPLPPPPLPSLPASLPPSLTSGTTKESDHRRHDDATSLSPSSSPLFIPSLSPANDPVPTANNALAAAADVRSRKNNDSVAEPLLSASSETIAPLLHFSSSSSPEIAALAASAPQVVSAAAVATAVSTIATAGGQGEAAANESISPTHVCFNSASSSSSLALSSSSPSQGHKDTGPTVAEDSRQGSSVDSCRRFRRYISENANTSGGNVVSAGKCGGSGRRRERSADSAPSAIVLTESDPENISDDNENHSCGSDDAGGGRQKEPNAVVDYCARVKPSPRRTDADRRQSPRRTAVHESALKAASTLTGRLSPPASTSSGRLVIDTKSAALLPLPPPMPSLPAEASDGTSSYETVDATLATAFEDAAGAAAAAAAAAALADACLSPSPLVASSTANAVVVAAATNVAGSAASGSPLAGGHQQRAASAIAPLALFDPKVCPVCERGFRDSHQMRRHLATHTKQKLFACPYCPHRSGRKDHLQLHVATRHRGCPQIGRRYESNSLG